MTIFILRYLFLFVTGSMLGWVLEVFYRRYFGAARRWINPGFLSGPFLPLYGTGVCLLFIVSDFPIAFWQKVILFGIVTTLIEYVTGIFFLKYYKTRLWDYSNLKFNIQGLISPLYSFFWTLLSLFFYYVLYPYFYLQIDYLYNHLELSLFVGFVLGIVFIDMTHSFDIINRVKRFAEMREEHVIIDYEQLKVEIKDRLDNISEKVEHMQDNLAGRVGDFGDGIEQRVNGVKSTIRVIKPTFLRPFRGNYELLSQLRAHIDLKKIRERRNGGKKS